MNYLTSHPFEVVYYWIDFAILIGIATILFSIAQLFSKRSYENSIFSKPIIVLLAVTLLGGATTLHLQTDIAIHKIPQIALQMPSLLKKYYLEIENQRLEHLITLSLFLVLEILFGIFISQSKYKRARIENESQIFTTVFEKSINPHIIYNSTGILRCNLSALQNLQVETQEQIINHSPVEFASFKQFNNKSIYDFFKEQEDLVNQKSSSIFEIKLKKINGSEFPALVTLSFIQIYRKPYFLMVWEDLSEKRKAQEMFELEKAKAMQASKLATLGEVSANISHEISNTLMMFVTYSASLRRMTLNNNLNKETLLDISSKMEKNVVRITKIIKGLKNFARDGTKDPFEPFFVNQIINESLEFIHHKISTNEVELKITLPSNNVEADGRSVQISQVLLNLINNSIDAIQKNSEKWIHIELSENSIYTTISVTDSGHGIPDEIATKLMQPFFTTKDKSIGTGLGLSLSSDIMKDHKGELYLDRRSKNTKFVMKWPKHLIDTGTGHSDDSNNSENSGTSSNESSAA